MTRVDDIRQNGHFESDMQSYLFDEQRFFDEYRNYSFFLPFLLILVEFS